MALHKKGMGIEQIFMYIVMALTFALIMIFGYKAISGFLASGEEVELVQFQNQLEKAVKTIYTEYGSVRIEKFSLPEKFQQICFVDLDYFAELDDTYFATELSKLCSQDLAACDVVKEARKGRINEQGEIIQGYDAVDQNVFLKPQLSRPIKVYLISIFDTKEGKQLGFLCPVMTGGSFSLVLEGKGDHTELSQAAVAS